MARILVIEDSSFQRGIIRRMFGADGHEILEAADGESGLGLIADRDPECIILDLTMPKMSGIEVLLSAIEGGKGARRRLAGELFR